MAAPRRRVAIFGSSVNPPTGRGGHKSLVEAVAKLYDEVIVLPVYEHVFDSKRGKLAAFDHRVAMAQRCFANVQGSVTVSLVEKELYQRLEPGQRLGTFDVLQHLRALLGSEGTDFSLVLGSDTFADLCAGKWGKSAELLASTELVIMHRAGAPPDVVDHDKVRATVVQMPESESPEGIFEISSTAAREACANGDEALMRVLLEPSVVDYIKEHKLYKFGQDLQGTSEAQATRDEPNLQI